MDKRELDMYKLEDTIKALLENVPIKRIARLQKISKNTVKKYRILVEEILRLKPWIRDDLPALMEEFRRSRKAERYSENHGWLETSQNLVEELSARCPNYVRLQEVLKEKGFKGSYSSLLRYVSKSTLCKEQPIMRIESQPGELAQVDFGYVGKIYDAEKRDYVKAYVFVLVLAFSRDGYYEIVTSQDIKTWCRCHIHAFEHFGGVPKIIIPDNLKSAIIKASYCDPLANKTYGDLAHHYGFQIDPCLPGTPEHKGKVESGVKYVKNNFIPLRTFTDIEDANRQLRQWNAASARTRIHGTTRKQPEELFQRFEQQELLLLRRERFEIPVWKHLKVYRDIHIQFDKAYYSVPSDLRGQYVEARKTESQLAIFFEHELKAVHRPMPAGKRSTNKDHYPPDMGSYMKEDTDYCLREAGKVGVYTRQVVTVLLNEEAIRNLRGAQNILRLQKKYGRQRLEAACGRAAFFCNYSYGGIKNILEKELDIHDRVMTEKDTKLCSLYARDLAEYLTQKEVSVGNISTN
ncbi:MAG: IS21 family transposase [Spirochaetes bacterium]|nr:IS21 family transposase [Spirochaetota bacterium]